MVRRLIIIILAVLIFTSNPAFVSTAESLAATLHTVEERTQQQILGATLRLTMIARENASDKPSYVVSSGLGTLVQDGDANYIVTHDHWSRLAKKVRMVRMESAAGELLLEMTPSVFYSLIRYRDGGTMVMVAPPEMPKSITPVEVALDGQSLTEGQTLAIAFFQPEAQNQVSVEPVTVQAVEDYKGNASVMMQSLNGRSVEQGNSGGGVFAGSRLVGTMWETIRLRNQESGQQSSTDLSRAARYVYDDIGEAELAIDFSAAPARGGEF